MINEALDTLTTVIKLDPIFFDYNSSVIRTDATSELDKVVDKMKANPLMKVEVRSHCDCRGEEAYNQKLSEDRAKATVEYIIKRAKLTAAGFPAKNG